MQIGAESRILEVLRMTKRQLIDQILSLNESAEPGFLAQFQHRELDEYLAHLTSAKMPRGAALLRARRRRGLHEREGAEKYVSGPMRPPFSRRQPIMAAIERAEDGIYTPA